MQSLLPDEINKASVHWLRAAFMLLTATFIGADSRAQPSTNSSSTAPQPVAATYAPDANKFAAGFSRMSMQANRRALLTAVTDHDTLLRYAKDFSRRNGRGDASTLLALLARPYVTERLNNILNSEAARLDLGTRDLIVELQLARSELMLLLGEQAAATALLDNLAAKHTPDYQVTFSRDGRKATLADQIERLRSLNLNLKGGSLDGK